MPKPPSDAQIGLLDCLTRDDYKLTRDPGTDMWTLWWRLGMSNRWEYAQSASVQARVLLRRELIEHDGEQGPGRRRYVVNEAGVEAIKQHLGVTGS